MQATQLQLPKIDDKAIIITVFGIRGSGKSHLTAEVIEMIRTKSSKTIVFDVADEWGGHFVSSYNNYLEYKKRYTNFKTLVVKFSIDEPIEIISEIADQIIRDVYNDGLPTTLVFEEAQILFPLHGTSPLRQRLIMIGRHRNISIVANTQRPAQIYKGLLSQSEHVFCGKLFEKNDIQYLSGTIGKQNAEKLPTLKDHYFIEFTAGSETEKIKIVKA